MGTQLPLSQSSTAPTQFSANICCGQMAAWIKISLGMEVGLGPGDFVLDGDPASLSPKGGLFGPCLLRPNGWMDEAGTWHGGRPQPRRLCVRWRPSPSTQKGAEPPPQFSAHICCGQMVAWIKMPLGMALGLGPGDFVLHGDPAPPPQTWPEHPPNFRPMFIVAKRLDG